MDTSTLVQKESCGQCRDTSPSFYDYFRIKSSELTFLSSSSNLDTIYMF